MTVQAEHSSQEFIGNDVATTFSFNFPLFEKEDATVITIDVDGLVTALTLDVDYTMPGNRFNDGGDVVLNDPLPGDGTKENSTILIVSRDIEATQEWSVRNQGSFNPIALEKALDKLTMLNQECLKFGPESDRGTSIGRLEEGKLLEFSLGKLQASDYSFEDLEGLVDEAADSAQKAEDAAAALGYKGEWTPSTVVEIGGIYGYQGYEWRSLTGVSGVAPIEGSDWRRISPSIKEFNSVAEALLGSLSLGDKVIVYDYYGGVNPSNSGFLFFKVVAGGTGTADGGKYIDIPILGLQLEQNLKRPYDLRAYGARADNSTDTKPAWDALTLYIRQNFSGAEIRFEGNYFFSDTPIFYSAFIYQGGGKGNTSINLPDGKNGVQINPTPTASVSYLEMRDFSIKANNTYPSAPKETGLKLDLTAACRRLNIRDVDITGFTNGLDGKCPFYLCTFKNMQITGIVPRDINDIPNYTNDNSFGFASGFNNQVGDVRDATTVTMENVFTTSFGIGIHNRYTSAMQLINCVSERNFYGVLADKAIYGTMYQEWNKESVKVRGTFEPSGVNITAINEPASWGPFTVDTISAARASKFRTLSGNRGYFEYSDINPVVISTSTTYLEFNKLNGEVISPTSGPAHRTVGRYEIEVSFGQNNDPSAQGTYIFDVWVKEDGEASYRNVKRGFQRVVPDDDFIGTLQFNYKGIVRGNISNFRVSVSRVDGEAITIAASSLTAILREID